MLTLENKISEMSHLSNEQSSSNNDLVTFVSGLLLGNDPQARSWFSLFIRQKVSIIINNLENINQNMLFCLEN